MRVQRHGRALVDGRHESRVTDSSSPPEASSTPARASGALDEIHSFVRSFEALSPTERAEAEALIVVRRASVDHALAQAREAADSLQQLRAEVVDDARGPFDEARERVAMLQLVHALAVSHTQLLRRYQELQLSVAIARAIEQPIGIAKEQLEKQCPAISYGAVLRGSRDYDLPGDGECVVCQSDLVPSDRVRMLPCRHVFHCECLDPWLERATCCPTCRAAVCPPESASAETST